MQRGKRGWSEVGRGARGLDFVVKREGMVQGGVVDAVHGEGGDVHDQLLVRRGGAVAHLRVLKQSGHLGGRGTAWVEREGWCLPATRGNDYNMARSSASR
jgi:hypothetical protein